MSLSSTRRRPSPASAAAKRGRPPTISDEKILAAARDVFLESGIRATTAEVARRAGVSEGTLFHRYKSKDALFRAAMQFDPETGPERFAALVPSVGIPDLREALVGLGRSFLDFARVAIPMMMMSWSNPGGDYSLEKLLGRPNTSRPQRVLEGFVRGEMAAGRLEGSDPPLLVQAFLGALRGYSMSELLDPQDPSRPPADEFVDRLVDLLFHFGPNASTAPGLTTNGP